MALARRRTLVWRLYALGFVQLVVLGLAVFWVGYLLRPEPPHAAHPPPFDGRPRVGGLEGDPPPRPPMDGPPFTPPERPGPPPLDHAGHFPWPPLITFLVSGLVIVGVGSVVTARSLVRPLQTLARTARAFGRGDLTARASMRDGDEIGEVGRAFDEMAERIQSLLFAERELLANVSHELRTPLARVRVALDLAGEVGADAGLVSFSEVQTDLQEIETLINDILTTARLEIDAARASPVGFELRLEALAPQVLCERASDRLRARHRERAVEVDVAGDLPAIDVDPVLFRRVLDNLLENAHKYSPDAGAAIRLRAWADGASVVFDVADRGVGIKPDDLPLVFQPFFRGDRSRSRGTGGVGLGLTLVRRIVEAHGGSIELTSRVGQGTTARVVVPLHRGSSPVHPDEGASA